MLVMRPDLDPRFAQVVPDRTNGPAPHQPTGKAGGRQESQGDPPMRPWAGDPWVVLVDLDPPLLSDVLVGRLARPDLLVVTDAPPGEPHDVRITVPVPPSPTDPPEVTATGVGVTTAGPAGGPGPAAGATRVVELHLPAGSRVCTPTGARHRVIELECADVDLLRRALELLCPVTGPTAGDLYGSPGQAG